MLVGRGPREVELPIVHAAVNGQAIVVEAHTLLIEPGATDMLCELIDHRRFKGFGMSQDVSSYTQASGPSPYDCHTQTAHPHGSMRNDKYWINLFFLKLIHK